jgi:hypothetical protein
MLSRLQENFITLRLQANKKPINKQDDGKAK